MAIEVRLVLLCSLWLFLISNASCRREVRSLVVDPAHRLGVQIDEKDSVSARIETEDANCSCIVSYWRYYHCGLEGWALG
jgi:hypothetical protein